MLLEGTSAPESVAVAWWLGTVGGSAVLLEGPSAPESVAVAWWLGTGGGSAVLLEGPSAPESVAVAVAWRLAIGGTGSSAMALAEL